jgi:hypothetical protein
MPTKKRPDPDKIQATREAIDNARTAVSAYPGAAPMTLEAFIRFVERTWLDTPIRPDQN